MHQQRTPSGSFINNITKQTAPVSGMKTSFLRRQKKPLHINKENEAQNEESIPTIHLKQFSVSKPRIDFGDIMLGDELMLELCIDNPSSKFQDIGVERLPTQDGFTLRDVVFKIPPHTEYKIPIVWRPVKIGRISSIMVLTWDNKIRYNVALTGNCPGGDSSILNTSMAGGNRYRAQQIDTSAMPKPQPPSQIEGQSKADNTIVS